MELHAFTMLADDSEPEARSCPLQTQPQQVFPDVTPPGMAYVPYQLWNDQIYDAEDAMQQGTLFPILDYPFAPAGGDCS